MVVKDLMTRSPATCKASDSANDAARIMWECDCGAVPVLDDQGSVTGIVTDRDICMAAYFQGTSLAAIPLHSIMSTDVYTCEPDVELQDAERIMRTHQIRRLPVVDRRRGLVGLLSISDVAHGIRPDGDVRAASKENIDLLLQTVAAVSE